MSLLAEPSAGILRSPLLTDFYQLTMAHAYFERGMNDTAVFELFVRRLPGNRGFLIAAGLEQVIECLESFRFEPADIEFLASLGTFPQRFLDWLAEQRFTGSVHAMPEGTPFFANEPILRVTAPLVEAQLVESRVLNLMHFQTMVASKAARCTLVAGGRKLVDFGMRRAHGGEAAVLASRAVYIAGFEATATVEAGRRFGLPLSGTMAHSFVQAHDSEMESFLSFVNARGGGTTLLIDTYDTERAAHMVVELARRLESEGRAGAIRAVRIDSGDLAAQARMVRDIFDAAGFCDIQIVLSGSLDEYRLQELIAAGAPADAFGVGTHVDVSEDAPSLDMAYKLQEYASVARRKRSPGKATWPGRKQVFREFAADGRMSSDCVGLEDESLPGEPLLRPVMHSGRRIGSLPELAEVRAYCLEQLRRLPPGLHALDTKEKFPVHISPGVRALAERIDADTARAQAPEDG